MLAVPNPGAGDVLRDVFCVGAIVGHRTAHGTRRLVSPHLAVESLAGDRRRIVALLSDVGRPTAAGRSVRYFVLGGHIAINDDHSEHEIAFSIQEAMLAVADGLAEMQ